MKVKERKMLDASDFGGELTGGVAALSLTPLRPEENSPHSQNLQGDFRQLPLSLSFSFPVSLFRSVPYIMNTINL